MTNKKKRRVSKPTAPRSHNADAVSASSLPSSATLVHRSEEINFSGPLPPPGILAGYETALPGSAERILKMAEKEQVFSHKQEARIVSANIAAEKQGMTFGFIFLVVMCSLLTLSAMYLILNDKEVYGFITLALGLIPAALTFFGRKSEKQKNKDAQGTSEKPARD